VRAHPSSADLGTRGPQPLCDLMERKVFSRPVAAVMNVNIRGDLVERKRMFMRLCGSGSAIGPWRAHKSFADGEPVDPVVPLVRGTAQAGAVQRFGVSSIATLCSRSQAIVRSRCCHASSFSRVVGVMTRYRYLGEEPDHED
jgi:hypothetical protein